MYKLLIFFSFINSVISDIIYPKDYHTLPINHISSENLIALSLWGMTSGLCIKKILDYKNKLPIEINKVDSTKREYFNIQIKQKQNIKKDIKKLKKDLNEIKKLLIQYEKDLS